MARVTLDSVSKTFPGSGRPAVNALSLDILDREFIVLVGPSGCGKSTTLRMIAGLEPLTHGTIRIGDRVVNDLPERDRDIAMVFQNYALYPFLSVYDNMAFALKLQRRRLGLTHEQIHQRVMQAAEILGIIDCLDRNTRALSGGQRQRVALGRAIVRNPKAFLFDEPLSHLDPKLRQETRAQLKRLHLQLQTTTIYVTHDQEEAMTLGDRIVVMKDGILQQCAPPLDVYNNPVNRFVAEFVGTPPMNFLEGRIDNGLFAFGEHRIKLPARMSDAAIACQGRPMVLGVRPESLSPIAEGKFQWEGNHFDVKVNIVEPLGDRVDISVSTSTHERIICRTDSHEFGKTSNGSIICLFMDLGRVHLFEPGDNGVNITLTRESSHAAA